MRYNEHRDLILATAMRLADLGFSIIPMIKKTKLPAVEWQQYQELPASTDMFDRWFMNTMHNIGIVCGKVSGGLLVIDFDTDADQLFPQWLANCADIVHRHQLPVVKTSKGYHVYMRCSNPIQKKLALRPTGKKGRALTLIETRGEGGVVVSLNSQHASGHVYSLLQGSFESMTAIDDDELSKAVMAAMAFDERPTQKEHLDHGVPNESMRSVYHLQELALIADQGAGEGNRNTTAFWLACRLVEAGCGEDEGWTIMQRFAQSCDPIIEDPHDLKELYNTYKSAWKTTKPKLLKNRIWEPAPTPEPEPEPTPQQKPEQQPEQQPRRVWNAINGSIACLEALHTTPTMEHVIIAPNERLAHACNNWIGPEMIPTVAAKDDQNPFQAAAELLQHLRCYEQVYIVLEPEPEQQHYAQILASHFGRYARLILLSKPLKEYMKDSEDGLASFFVLLGESQPWHLR